MPPFYHNHFQNTTKNVIIKTTKNALISEWSGEGEGSGAYQFTIADDAQEYQFEYYFDEKLQTVVVKKD